MFSFQPLLLKKQVVTPHHQQLQALFRKMILKLYELEEKRNEYSKTFKLEDGSFLELTSFRPIHTLIDNEWVDGNTLNTENIETVADAIQLFNSESVATNSSSARSISNVYDSESTAKIKAFSWSDNNYVATDSLKIINDNSAIVVKPNELGATPGKTRIVTNAQVILNCEKGDPEENDGEDIEHNFIAVYEATVAWTEETMSYDIDSYYGDIIYDSINIQSAKYYSWDITQLYNLWERDLAEHNGVIFKSHDEANVVVNDGGFAVRYYEISPIDENFNYHYFDMGRAGQININEFSNDVTITRNDIGISSNTMPVSIGGLYYENNILSSPQYGNNWRFNYNSILLKDKSVYVWHMMDGNSVSFYKDVLYGTDSNGLSKWLDEDNKYELYVDENSSSITSNYIISDAITYRFEEQKTIGSAFLTSIENQSGSISISYDGGNILSITDGEGREYCFEYSTAAENKTALTKISAVMESTNSNNDSQNIEPIAVESYDGNATPIEIYYEYTKINDTLFLSGVTFSDGESISYGYDNNGRLTSVTNIDGSVLTITYLDRGKKYKLTNANGTEIDTLEIDDHNLYQRIITYADNSYEKIYYNQILKCKHYQKYELDENGYEVFVEEKYYEYDNNGQIISIFIPETDKENELLENVGFESKKSGKPSLWNPISSSDTSYYERNTTKHHDSGTASLSIRGRFYEEMFVWQNVEDISSSGIVDGDTIAIGGYGLVSTAIPAPNHFVGVKVIAYYTGENETVPVEICEVSFDTKIIDEWQYAVSSFKVETEYEGKILSYYEVRCSSDYQDGTVYFDDLKMFKTENQYDIIIPVNCVCEDCAYGLGCPCECESSEQCSCEECKPTVLACGCDENSNWGLGCSCSSENISVCNCVGNNIVTDEETGLVISDGTKQMMTTKIYDSDSNYLSKTIDENGIETFYNYNSSNGLLESVENANGKTEYYYNALGMLEKISVAVSSLSDNNTHIETDYNYVNDKISSITHNGFTYYFYYNEYGDYQTIKVGNEILISYGYDDNQQLNQITYANGDVIYYEYDSTNDMISNVYINQTTTPVYHYEYNDLGEVAEIVDNSSGLTIKYNHAKTMTDEDGIETNIIYDVLIHRTGNENDIRYYKIVTEDKVIENITEEEYIQNSTITNYNCETGITTSSTKTEHGGMSFITASATDVFGRRTNTPENTSVNNNSWNETISSSNAILQKDSRDLVVSKSETNYYYDDTESSAKTQVTGYQTKVSNIYYNYFDSSYFPFNVTEEWETSGLNYHYVYDENGNIIEVYTYAEDGVTLDRLLDRYTYDDNQRVIREDHSGNANGAYSWTYTYYYDENGRVTRRDDFSYTLGELGEDTTPLYFIFNETNQLYYYVNYTYNWNSEYSYEYDGVGNISKVYSGLGENKSLILSYEYDEANQLVRENNKNLQKTFVYTYDAGGNISSKTEYEYTTDAQISSTATNTINYSYDSVWKDKLTSYNDKMITYDALGNPLTVGDKNSESEEYREYEWQGKQLISCTILNRENNPDSDEKYVYTYDSNGLRSSKTSYDCDDAGNVDFTSAIRTEYLWQDGKLIYLWLSPEFDNTADDKYSDSLSIKYLYDENDEPYGMITNGSNVFYFIKNMQGDIERIVTSNKNTRMITYSYDAWGNMTYSLNSSDIETMLGSMLMLANNVVTYRGYTYDFETGLYYLQSRYYSPEWGRFLNADSYCDTETSIIGTNMFAYCDNNPVNYIDPEGFASVTINVYSGGVGHADITIDSTTYAFGNYQKNTSRWEQITGKAKGYLVVATPSEWLKKERTQYSVETFTISVSDSEKKSIETFCKNIQQKGSWYRYPWDDKKVGSIYKINSGTYSNYSLLTKNCVHFTVRATASGIRSRLTSLSKKVYGDSNKIFSVFLPASFRSFMYQYMANYYCVYNSYSKTA